MSETPKPSEENEVPIWDTPEFRAGLAYVALDRLTQLWVEEHPGVSKDDVDAAFAALNEAIAERDKHLPPDEG